jgi:hypothetical protein
MVYFLVELFNYRQLARLRSESLTAVEGRLSELCAARFSGRVRVREGSTIVECGREEGFDAAACSSLAVHVLELLRSRRDEMFGFSLFLSAGWPGPEQAEAAAAELALETDRDGELWVSAAAAPLFESHFMLESGQRVLRVIAPRPARAAQPPVPEESRVWVRENMVQRALDALTPRLNGVESPQGVFLFGPSGAGKTQLLQEMSRRLGVGDEGTPLLRMYTLFRRRSPLHPFINSLSPEFLSQVPRHLHGAETEVWNELGGLLAGLRGAELATGEAGPARFPDRLIEDFTLGYQLYLLAYVRMTQSRLLPAILACEGVESYHPAARRAVARVIADMLVHPNFLPVFSSAEEALPEELSGFETAGVYVHPLGKREIRSLARHMFPGVEIPEGEVRRLRRRSAGLYIQVVSYLLFLKQTGRITEGGGSFSWVQSAQEEAQLPANPLSVSWFLIRSLADDSFLLLYALYLAGGLLDRPGFLAFLAASGFDLAAVERSMSGLVSSGLVAEEGLIPRIAGLRRRLEELLGREGETLKGRLIIHLFDLWRAGRYQRQVLLFSFLAKAGRTALALQVLPEIIRRKLDEGDHAGARAFCDPGRLEFDVAPNTAEREALALTTHAGRLRAFLLEGRVEEAAELSGTLGSLLKGGAAGDRAGDARLARALAFLSAGTCPAALEELKAALLMFQESGYVRGERSAYHLLGLTMLGDGRLNEAREYLGMSERLSSEAGDALGALRASVHVCACLFIEGRLTHCLQRAEASERTARSLGQRGFELYLLFLRARCLFQLGLYDQSSLHFQSCLCTATLYSMEAAQSVLRAWLGRSILYQGDAVSATRYLERMDQGKEALFFLSEAALLAGNLENASLYAERALARSEAAAFPPPEGVGWRDGFVSTEGRCFRLSRGDAFFRRQVRATAGYLLGLRGLSRGAVLELHKLTRGEDSREDDPNAYLHAYLYSLVLPEDSADEGDDKTTVLSRSLKGLQERASRIELPSHKSAFLASNYWNRRIMDDAREKRIV